MSEVDPATPSVDAAIVDALRPLIAKLLGAAAEDLSLKRLTGGNSVVTLLASAGDDHVVVRVPPLAHRLPSAQDVLREYRALAVVHLSDVPAPRPIAVLWLPTIAVHALVEEYVDGVVLAAHTPEELQAIEPKVRRSVAESTVTTLANLHAIPLEGSGLGSTARAGDYFHRQVRRWRAQVRNSDHPDGAAWAARIGELCDRLMSIDPAPARPGIVHGDYDLHNLLFEPSVIRGARGRLCAVLDWEMCTAGDVRADIGWLLSRIGEDIPVTPLTPRPSVLSGWGVESSHLIELYEDHARYPVRDIEPFRALARIKQGAIWLGHLTRTRRGAKHDPRFDDFTSYSDLLLKAWLGDIEVGGR